VPQLHNLKRSQPTHAHWDPEESSLCRRFRLRSIYANGKLITARCPMTEWKIVGKDRYPANLDWQGFEKVQAMLRDNHAPARWRRLRPGRATKIRLEGGADRHKFSFVAA
jgi:hypothetical protein